MIIPRQNHPCYSFEWHDEKSVLFSRNTSRYIHPEKKKSGALLTFILLFLIVITSILSFAFTG